MRAYALSLVLLGLVRGRDDAVAERVGHVQGPPACQQVASAGIMHAMNEIRISPRDAAKRVESGNTILLDVVGESAWRSLREVPRGALRVPPDEISSRLAEIPDGRAVIAFCT